MGSQLSLRLCVTLGKFLNLSESYFLLCKVRIVVQMAVLLCGLSDTLSCDVPVLMPASGQVFCTYQIPFRGNLEKGDL